MSEVASVLGEVLGREFRVATIPEDACAGALSEAGFRACVAESRRNHHRPRFASLSNEEHDARAHTWPAVGRRDRRQWVARGLFFVFHREQPRLPGEPMTASRS